MNKKLAHYAKRFWGAWFRDILIVLAIMIPVRSSIADWNHVPTGSMKPSILECERVFVNKLAYDLKVPLTTWHLAQWSNPKRGDIVVFKIPSQKHRLVKRVIGLPGDVVELNKNRLIINGQTAEYLPLDPRYITYFSSEERSREIFARERLGHLNHPVMAIPAMPANRTFGPITIPANSYFMLGDNRDNSADSRFFGFVERSNIVGKATAVVASFDPDRSYRPRWGRWFKGLS